MNKIVTSVTAAVMSVMFTFSCAFASGDIPPIAEGGEAVQSSVGTDDILNNSIINFYNMNKLLNKGAFEEINVSDNISKEIDNVTYANLSWFRDLFGTEYAWDGASSMLTLKNGEKSIDIKCAELEALGESSDEGFFYNRQTFIPLAAVCSALGYYYYRCDDFWALSGEVDLENAVTDEIRQEITDKNKTVLAAYDFDETKPAALSGAYWSNASAGSFVTACEVSGDGENGYLKAGATTVGYGGVYLPGFEFDRNSVITVSFDVKASEDFEGSAPQVMAVAYNGDTYVSFISGITTTAKKDEWTHITGNLDVSKTPDNAKHLRLMFGTTNKNTGNAPAGYLMYDNLEVASYTKIEDASADAPSPLIRADNHVNWYVLGDTITMTPTNKIDEELYPKVKIEIYDSFDNIVSSETVSTNSFNSGYSYTPQKAGYYEYQFYTVDQNKKVEELNEYYQVSNPRNSSEKIRFYVKRQGVVVAKSETKPPEERNERLYVCTSWSTILNPANSNGHKNGSRMDYVEIASLVGFNGVRYQFDSNNRAWRTEAKMNMYRGDFRFDELDGSVNEATKYGMDVILTIMGAPTYATPYRHAYNSPDNVNPTYYMPNDIKAWEAYVDEVVKRYKDVCNKWEIWNEPHILGGSIFWCGITSDYAELQKSGYEVVKKYQPGDSSIVTLGGIGARRYVPFYKELMEVEGIYDYYDILAMHGWDLDPWTYNSIAAEKGLPPKDYATTEGHPMLRRSDSEYINNDEKEEAIRGITEFLKDFKYGSKFTAMFEVGQLNDIEYLRWCNEKGYMGLGQEGGLYRLKPFCTPRFAAVAMHNFFENMGKEYEYADEYLLESKKQNVVRFKNDGEEQLIVWSTKGSKAKEHTLSKMITACANESFRIVDWEGNDVDVSDIDNIIIKPETMYFVYGLDSDKLDTLPSGQGDEVYLGDVLYNTSAKQLVSGIERKDTVVALGTTQPLFDKDTFALSDNIEYVEDNWKWVAEADGADREDFSAKYALSVTEDGLYLVVKAKDAADDAEAESPDKMYQKDSIQFAFDTVGDRSETGYMECQFGEVQGTGTTVYKQTAPYIGGDLIADFTPADTVISRAKSYRRHENGETTYMVYLPNNEIYPYIQDINYSFNFSVLVNQSNGSGRLGYLEWGGGIGKEKNPAKYGRVWLDENVFNENGGYFPPLEIGSNKPLFDLNTLEYTDDIPWITDRINWVGSVEKSPDFDAKFAVSVTDDGFYLVAEVTDSDIMTGADNAGNMWGTDSMQFAIDPFAAEFTDNRIEFQFGKVLNDTVLYKQDAPAADGATDPNGYTAKTTNVTSGVHDMTVEGNKITYKVYLPIAELHSFNAAENDCIRISVLFNDNKNGTRDGYLEWSSGIGATKNAKQYGIISYK